MATSVRVSIDGPVALLTLAAPEKENRLDPGMLEELAAGISRILSLPEIRVAILRADGEVFCNGMDLGAATSGDAADAHTAAARRAIEAYSNILRQLSDSRIPFIAAVNAPVRAGGVGLVAACDIVIAAEGATFELSEVRFGLIPANVLPYLLGWRLSPQRTRYLVLTARKLTGTEAASYGLADEYVQSADDLERAVRASVKGLLRSSPDALGLAKRYTAEWAEVSREQAVGAAVTVLEDLVTDPKTRASITAFGQGELPPWFVSYKPSVPLSKE